MPTFTFKVRKFAENTVSVEGDDEAHARTKAERMEGVAQVFDVIEAPVEQRSTR